MSFSLSARSRAELKGVHPDLVAVVERAIALTAQDFCVHDGVRTLEQQKALVRAGASRTLNSRHLIRPDGFGHAVDLVPWIGGKPRWEWKPIYLIAVAVRRAAVEQGVALIWGGVWDRRLADLPETATGLEASVRAYTARHPGPDFIDGPHFELGS
ncbi:MAG: M15 family metallopeptidase [Pseudomonadota bacterium]